MRNRQCLVAILIVVVMSAPVFAENTVTIESKDACVSDKGVTVGVYLSNDVQVRQFVLPLEVRSGEGKATAKTLSLGWGGRLPAKRGEALGDNVFNHTYFKKDCDCPTGGQGFGLVAHTDTLPHEIASLPVGVLLSRLRFTGPDLLPGNDSVSASVFITLDVGPQSGEIIIDTTCICPNHHLAFVHGANPVQSTKPAFAKGVITVGTCAKE